MKRVFKTVLAIAIIAVATISWKAKQQTLPTYNLKLTEQEIQVVLTGLSKLPYEQSAGVIQKIVGQAQDSTIQKKK